MLTSSVQQQADCAKEAHIQPFREQNLQAKKLKLAAASTPMTASSCAMQQPQSLWQQRDSAVLQKRQQREAAAWATATAADHVFAAARAKAEYSRLLKSLLHAQQQRDEAAPQCRCAGQPGAATTGRQP
jgi:hypothetical protein